MRPLLLAAALLPVVAVAQEPAKPAKSGWTLMVEGLGHRAADLNRGGVAGTYERSALGFEAIHEGPDHALDLEYYEFRNRFTGAIAADSDRSYGDVTDLRLSAFVQAPAGSAHGHYQLIGGFECAPEDTLGFGDAFRWALGGAYRWTPGAEFDVALGVQVVSRYEQSLLPIPYVRAFWRPDPSVSVEFRVTGLQNGFFGRWFITADKATSLDLACAYETHAFRLTDGSYGGRGLGIGEVPLRVGLTQFLEPSGTWFARVGLEWVAQHRSTYTHDGETRAVFETVGTPGWSVRLGGRF